MLEGKITKGIGGFYYVDTEKGIYECRARGIFRKQKITPLVGDRVKISVVDEEITKGIGGFYYVDTEKGIYECRARGIFRKQKITPLVGDRVKISVVDEETKKGVVEEIDKRDTELIRPPIANVDKALIVFAVKNPKPHLSLCFS